MSVQNPLEGQQIGRYIIRTRLGGGGVATVYQAYDQVSGQSVALKLLPPNPEAGTLQRFRREALEAGALRHPHIVRVIQVGTAGDGPSAYIAMDLVEGESLAALLTRFGKLRAEESSRLLEPIARALAFAHQHGVVHRDVKPSNILLRAVSMRPENVRAEGMRAEANGAATTVSLDMLEHPVIPLLSDFGIARFIDQPELTSAGRTVGTPAFMAPEQCAGSREIDGRADIYALGTVLYRCVVGKLPFGGSTTQILHAHVFDPVVIDEAIARQLSPKMLEILRRTLAKAPEDRYQHAEELADELAAFGASAPAGGADAATTMTVELPVHAPSPVSLSAPSGVQQVLVPGTTEVATPVAPSNMPKAVPPKLRTPKRRGPSVERVVWAAFFVILIGGGVLWNVNTWLASQRNEQPLGVVVLTRNPPTPGPDGGVVPPATATQTALQVETATSLPTATVLPSATPSPLPTVVPTTEPTVMPTSAAPTIVPTQVPPVVEVPTPLAEPTATPTAVANEMITPGEELAGVCSTVVDGRILARVAALSGDLREDFACPSQAAEITTGEWLEFEQGTMVVIATSPLVYVVYADGSWEQVTRSDAPVSDPAFADLPTPFAQVYADQGRHLLLGEARQAQPQPRETLVQRFMGGVVIADGGGEQVLFLSRTNLRF